MPLTNSSWAHARMTSACGALAAGGGFAAGMTAALAEEAWDIVLCAHRMPAFDAFTTLAVLGASGLEVPLIFVSGERGEETAVAAIHAGAADSSSRDHVDCLGVVVARCLRHQRPARRTGAQADAAARESRERSQVSIGTLIDRFVSVRP
jgi:DNA-binding NtrC family response regulator